MLTVIAYDIADDRRRQRVSTFLEDHGWRVNYSVFECDLNAREFDQLRGQLARLVNPRQDRVLFYRLCEGCRPRKVVLGQTSEDEASTPGVRFI
jgi:CRISPR-associated protein Cas2